MPDNKHPQAKPLQAGSIAAARLATKLQFFTAGLLFATWGVHIPTVRSHYGLDEAQLSGLMLAAGVGALISLFHVSRWITRWGSRAIARLGALTLILPFFILLDMPNYAGMLFLLFLFGLGNSAFEVAISTDAVAVENAYARPIMSSFHAFFSLGGMVGAGLGSLIAWAGISPSAHLLSMAFGSTILVALTSIYTLSEPAHPTTPTRQAKRLPPPAILLLGLLAMLAFVGEGAIYDWSTLYMIAERESSAALAALSYGAFSATMALGRFSGDTVRHKIGAYHTLRLSAWLAACGIGFALIMPHSWAALGGFALAGLGFANIVPVIFSASARVTGVSSAQGIAAVAACGYFGLLFGPPLIGGIAHATNLSIALLVIGACLIGLALLSTQALRNR